VELAAAVQFRETFLFAMQLFSEDRQMTRRTYLKQLGGWPMPWPADMHVHFRLDKDMMGLVIPIAAYHYCYTTAMPNLGPDRIRTPLQALEYRQMILRIGQTVNPEFDVNVPLYLEPDTDPKVVRQGFERKAWIAAKLYPRGGTTGSEEGVDFCKLDELDEVFGAINELGMMLLIHAEPQSSPTGTVYDVFDREQRSHQFLHELLTKHRGIKVVFEHVSSAETIPFLVRMKAGGHTIGATVAPQYLVWSRNSLFQGGMNPLRYSIPVLKRERDRLALVEFVTDGDIAFLGTDSAPHPVSAKSKHTGCPGGVFNSPVALFTYFEVFKNSGCADWFDRFVEFACFRGPEFYGLPVYQSDAIVIKERLWRVPDVYENRGARIIPMMAGQQMEYSVGHI